MLFIAFQGMFLSIIFMYVTPSNQRVLNFLFSGLMLSIALYILPNFIENFPVDYPRLYLLSNLFIYPFTSIFYLLNLILFRDANGLTQRHLLLFLPIIVYLLFLSKYLILPDTELFYRLQEGHLFDLNIIDLLTLIFNLFLIYKCLELYNRDSSQLEVPQKRLILSFNAIIFFCNMIWLNTILLHLGIFGIDWDIFQYTSHWIAISLLILFPLAFAVINSNFITSLMLKKDIIGMNINESEMEEMKNRIKNFMNDQKPYLDPDFSLTDLSLYTGIRKFQLSRLLNHYMMSSFFDMVNEYRVQELLTRTSQKQNENISLIDIAYHSGFKSKSTFYKAFKSIKGETPKDYLKRIRSPYYKY